MAHAARLNLRMQKEVKLLLTDPPPGVSLVTVSDNDSSSSSPSLSSIEAWIEGPEGSVYSNGVFNIRIQVPERYPFQPPNITSMTPVYHPNIDNGGRICLDILNLPPKGVWQPSLNISTVLTSIGLLLSEPNPDDGLMCEISREYKYNRQVFDQKARSWTEKYAKAGARRDSNDCDILANSSTVVEAEVASASTEDLVHDNERTRKKCRLVVEKLSLKSMATAGSCNSEEEDVPPTRWLSLSRSQNLVVGVAKSESLRQVVTNDEPQHSQQNHDSQATNGSQEWLDKGLKIIETVIVSDSEESEEEGERPTRPRLSSMRKRIAGKRKVEGRT